jgi:Zn-dependent metalloprotease
MLHPGTAYDDPKIGTDPQPATMKDFINTTRDNGGVHLNSGIPNRAFAEFATKVGGNAWEAPGKIWYEARANAGSTPSFANFAYQTIQAAKKLGFTDDLPKLQQAWSDVGVKPSAHAAPTRLGFIPFFTNTDDKKAA